MSSQTPTPEEAWAAMCTQPAVNLSLACAGMDNGFSHLTEFIRQHGHARVPYSHKTSDGYLLGQWISKQRRKHLTGDLDADREQRLGKLRGWVWSAFDAAWEDGFSQLVDYIAQHGDSRVAAGHITPNGFRLGRWVARQRSSYASGDLSSERRQRLEALPGWS